ncbi:MAG: hypothetical protein KAS96_05870, partial [Planctomycetes bacterium]|nr:hypothetical protein [Planctomycetota bacterium]
YYIDFLAALDAAKSKYILLNFIVPDNDPGDMDIVIPFDEYEKAVHIMRQQAYYMRGEFNTGQFLWNKYVDQVGFIQIHIHVDYSFFGRKIISFNDLYNGESVLTIEKEYVLFLVETFYKNNYSCKQYKYGNFQKILDKARLDVLVAQDYGNIRSIINKAKRNYDTKNRISKLMFLFHLFKENRFKLLINLFSHIRKKILKQVLPNKKDIFVVLLGVDGSGKTTLANNIQATCAKGGIFTKIIYMGIKNSIVNNVRGIFASTLKKTDSVSANPEKEPGLLKKIYVILVGILYWVEYNLKWIFKIKLKAVNTQTLWLLDRSYLDVLVNYKSQFLSCLFLKFSFKPDMVFFLVAEVDELYARKQERNNSELRTISGKYTLLADLVSSSNLTSYILDTGPLSAEETLHIAMKEINKIDKIRT